MKGTKREINVKNANTNAIAKDYRRCHAMKALKRTTMLLGEVEGLKKTKIKLKGINIKTTITSNR